MNILDILPVNGPDDCVCTIRLNIARGFDFARFTPVKAWPCWIKDIQVNLDPPCATLVVEFITIEDRNVCLKLLMPHPTQ